MTRLEKSIRHELAPYGPALRAGHYNAPGHTGFETERGTIAAAYCDVNHGVVEGVRLYGVEDALIRRDHFGETCDITDAFYSNYGEGYLYRWDWDEFINDIVTIVEAYQEQKEQEVGS